MELNNMLRNKNIECKCGASIIQYEIKHPEKVIVVEEYPNISVGEKNYFKLYTNGVLIHATYGKDLIFDSIMLEFE